MGPRQPQRVALRRLSRGFALARKCLIESQALPVVASAPAQHPNLVKVAELPGVVDLGVDLFDITGVADVHPQDDAAVSPTCGAAVLQSVTRRVARS